ncbi:hypothetical protein [Prochlorococcus marinus]|nr:hypothetical protein [Prochlorococcus marinus]
MLTIWSHSSAGRAPAWHEALQITAKLLVNLEQGYATKTGS